MRLRPVAIFLGLCGLSLAACAAGSSGGGAAGTAAGPDASVAEGGSVEGGGAVGPTGTTGPTGTPGVYDGGPPAVVGGPIDSGGGAGDASEDAADAQAACGAPDGSYAATCTNCAVAENTLTCDCQTSSSASATTSLDLCACSQTTEISNSDGVLFCCGSPNGSYTNSCSGCSLTGSMLACDCKMDDGGLSPTTLDLCTCQSTTKLANTNGVLSCQ